MISAPLPYLPSLRWTRLWLANGMPPLPSHPNRTVIMRPGDNMERAVTLTVPLVGGAAAIKRLPPDEWQISGHGNWQHVHAGAIEAAYGRSPFYPHLASELTAIICKASEGDSFTAFSASLMEVIGTLLELDKKEEFISRMNSNPEFFNRICLEKTEGVNKDLSLIDVIFTKGRDSLFTLL